jgi:release factor glutamine methyltransferase
MRYSALFSNALKKFKGSDKALDIQVLIEAAFNLTRTEFWTRKNETITDITALRKFYRYRTRLLKNEPIAYILKKKEFYGETFFVNKNVLIPRPETEILVEKAIQLLKAPAEILDIGAGSGIIAILLAKHTDSTITAIENSKKALYVLKKNIIMHNSGARVFPVRAELFPSQGKKFDMIVSNPPYISETEWGELDPTVRDYEPKTALVADEEGMAVIRQIVEKTRTYLKPGGKLLVEIGYNQKQRVNDLLKKAEFSNVEFFNDYSHIPRVAVAHIK